MFVSELYQVDIYSCWRVAVEVEVVEEHLKKNVAEYIKREVEYILVRIFIVFLSSLETYVVPWIGSDFYS